MKSNVKAASQRPANARKKTARVTGRVDNRAIAMNEALVLSAVRQHELMDAAEAANAQLQVEIARHIRTARELQEARTTLEAQAGALEKTVNERTAELRESIVDLEAFSYSVAHDLRAPIRAIRGFTEFALELCRQAADPAPIVFLERVIGAAARMDKLIQDLLTLSAVSRERLAFSPVDLDGLVRSLIQERPEFAPPLAEIEIARPLLAVRGHQASLSQSLANLLGNAVKFVAPGVVPRVRVWTEELPAPATTPTVRLWIEDNGIGIPAESQQRIFEIFQRLHPAGEYEGTGIGLAIVRKAIERMGGRVGVWSEPGKGSRFWVELPKA